MTDTVQAEPFVDGLFFGECPRWHDGRLWYSDFFAGAVSSAGPGGDTRVELEVDGEPGGLGWLPDGRLLVVDRLGRAVWRVEADGAVVTHGSLGPWATWHGNDMVVSATGHAYCGNFGFDLDALYEGSPDVVMAPTSLVRLDPEGRASEAAADLAFPNGTVITPDGSTLVVAESMGGRLTAFDVAADGALSGRREWAALPGVAPDGTCLDAEGCIWVANAVGPECLRVAEGGEVRQRVATSTMCFACMLGGEDRRTLYLMVAPSSQASVARAGRRAAIEQVRVDVPGAGLP